MTTQLDSLRRYVATRPLPPSSEAPERVLLVGSGKGGIGTSTVAALLAVMAASDGQDVLLVDADESHGALPMLMGVEPRHPLSRLRGGEVTPNDLLIELGTGLSLLPLGGTGDPGEHLPAAERRALLRRAASTYGQFDLVIVDAGSKLEQVLAAAASGAARLLAVTAAERISAAATYALIKMVDDRCAGLPIDLLFNRSNLSVATGGFDEIDAATRHFLRRGIDFAGAVPDDDRLRTTMADGVPLQDAAALGTPATTACHELVARITRLIDERSLAVVAPRLSPRR